MAAEDDSHFFSRWSRRKVQVRSGQPLPAEPPVAVPEPARANPAAAAPAATQARARPETEATPAAPAPEAPPALTLDDVARLTPEGDFKPYMARQVAPEVRNAAVKKLFTDPHFNIMDGLDIYIDDYSKPSPLSAADMAQMVGAKFLKLVDDPAHPDPKTPVHPVAATADTPAPEAGAAPEETRALDGATPEETQDDHADLQLQPDHAPEPQGPGRGAG